eukprot:6172600-Pleurochrysis_carterae.AAC.2
MFSKVREPGLVSAGSAANERAVWAQPTRSFMHPHLQQTNSASTRIAFPEALECRRTIHVPTPAVGVCYKYQRKEAHLFSFR